MVSGPVIDLARLLSGFCAGLVDNGIFFDALLRAAELSTENAALPSSKAKETNALLVLRTVANALQEGTKIGDGGWIKEVSSHGTSFYISLTYCPHPARFSEFWEVHHMRNSRRVNASLSLLYFSSKHHLSDYLRWS
jgi:hypothetical protein